MCFTVLGCILIITGSGAFADEPLEEWTDDEWADEDGLLMESSSVYDPWEGLNRKFFVFNDKLYFWILKPVAQTYDFLVPSDIRVCLRNAVDNMFFPIRLVNNSLQGKIEEAGIETVRFIMNSTLGMAGLTDPAKDLLNLQSQDEDLGQTLGAYGIPNGPYLYLPFFGPTNIRDGVGIVGDKLLNPFFYLTWNDLYSSVGYYASDKINRTSLMLGEYEKFKEESFDVYVAMRDAYNQNRKSKIEDSGLTSQ